MIAFMHEVEAASDEVHVGASFRLSDPKQREAARAALNVLRMLASGHMPEITAIGAVAGFDAVHFEMMARESAAAQPNGNEPEGDAKP